MSQRYDPIPAGAKSLFVNLWSFDSCECHHMEIRALVDISNLHVPRFNSGDSRSIRLWEGVWWHSSPDEDYGMTTAEILSELREACLHYEIPLTDDNSVWDVKGERVLKV